MKISIVIPVHDEAEYLPYSLAALKPIEGDFHELIFVIDRCVDHSEEIIGKVFPDALLTHLDQHSWNFYTAETFQRGFDQATGDIIFACGADLVLDPDLPRVITEQFKDTKTGTVCFRYLNYDLNSLRLRIHGYYENIYHSLIQRFRKEVRHTGVYAFRKDVMDQIGGLADVISEYDEYCLRCIRNGWRVNYIPETKILHLRAVLTPRKQYLQGTARSYLPSYNLWKTFLHSVIHVKPYLTVGFLHAKRYGLVKAGTLR